MTAVTGIKTPEVPVRKSYAGVISRWCRRQPLGAFSGGLLLAIIVVAILAPWVAPYDPELNDFAAMLTAPSWQHPLGTDQFGRDILSRIIYGAQTALFVGFSAAILGSTFGLILGVTSAYLGGLFDLVFQRIMDVFMAFPSIIIALA